MTLAAATRFDVKNPVWEQLGKKVEGNLTSKEMIKAAGLDYQIGKKPVYNKAVRGKIESFEVVNGKFNVVRDDNQEVLGVVGKSYTVLQNREAFSMMDEIVGRKMALFDSAGSFGKGERIWALAKLDGVVRVKGDDVVNKFLLLSNSHNGSRSVEVAITAIRPVCMNSLNLACREAEKMGDLFKIRHSSKMADKVDRAKETLHIINKQFDDFSVTANAMCSVKLNMKKFDAFLGELGLDAEAEGGREAGTITAIRNAFESGPGSQLVSAKGTLWGALNSVTYFSSHEKATRVTGNFKSEDEARLSSTWFGSGNSLNQKALAVATKMVG